MKIRLVLFSFILVAATLPGAEEVHFGLTGITALETARLTAFCSADQASQCEVTFLFHNLRGSVLKQSTMTLDPGTGGFLDLRGSERGSTASRVEIVPCVRVGRGGVFLSFGVFDNFTNRTRLLTNWGDRSVPRSGDVDFGLAGITSLDTARLSAFCPADPLVDALGCDVTFTFRNIRGGVIKEATMTIAPGTAGFLDLRGSERGSTASRVEITPCIRVGRAAVGGLQLIDNLTGLTTVLAYPATLLSAEPPPV